jgi:hypothetical protein
MGESVMRKIAILALIVLSFTAAQVQAEGVSILAGFQTVSFGGDLGEYYDLPSGPGPVLNLSVMTTLGVPVDFTIGQRKGKEEYSGDEATYRWAELGPRFILGREDLRVRPEFGAGAGYYNLDIGSEEFDGAFGYYFSFGFEDQATEHLTGRFQIKSAYWKTDTGSLDAPTLNFVLMYGYRF